MAPIYLMCVRENMERRVRARTGVSPIVVRGFNSLPRDLQRVILDHALLRMSMANRIRTAYRLFKRRVQSSVAYFVYKPSAQARDVGDSRGSRVVRGYVV